VTTVVELSVHRGESPWLGFTSSADEEERGRHVEALASLEGLEVPARLARYVDGNAPWLAVDRERRVVVVNARVFGNLTRVDVTSLARGETRTVGRVMAPVAVTRARDVVLFLLESQVIQTFIHLEADLRLVREEDRDARLSVHVEGVHRFFTHRKNERPLAFFVTVDKGQGEVTVTWEGEAC
jgi:hypothetical protein